MTIAPPINQDLLPNECPKCRKILHNLVLNEWYCPNCGYFEVRK